MTMDRTCKTSIPLLLVLLVGPAYGQSRLTMNGYLSQAYGFTISDGYQFLGLPQQGTSDYRTLALQFGYTLNDDARLVMQLSHKRLGHSPLMEFEDEIKLDWAFAEYWIGERFAARVGKVQLPLGIYNEVRDVGTLLPFYRIPFHNYGEGSWTSETLDGLVLSGHLWPESSWNLDVHTFYGGWEFIKEEQITEMRRARVENAFGSQIWLNTPIEALRFGYHLHRMTILDEASDTAPETDVTVWAGSAEYDLKRISLKSEYITEHFGEGSRQSFFSLLGYRLSSRFRINGQVELNNLKLTIEQPFFSQSIDRDNSDYAVSVNYAATTYLVLKAEHHWMKGFNIDNEPGILLDPVTLQYSILSLSAAF